MQSYQLTLSTGKLSPLNLDGLLPITAAHSFCVTSYLPTKKSGMLPVLPKYLDLVFIKLPPFTNTKLCGAVWLAGFCCEHELAIKMIAINRMNIFFIGLEKAKKPQAVTACGWVFNNKGCMIILPDGSVDRAAFAVKCFQSQYLQI